MSLFHPIIAGLDPISWVYIILFAVAAGVSYSGMQKAKRAAQQALERTRGLVYQSRAAAFPRRIIYGRRRVGGLEIFLGTSGVKNEYMHWIFYWCEGPVNAVDQLMFNGEVLPMEVGNPNGSDVQSGKYHGFATARHRRGDAGNYLPPSEPIAQLPGWAATDLGIGCAWSWVRIKYDENVFAQGFPDVSAVIEGRNDVYDPRDMTYGYTDNVALCFNHYMTLPRLGPNIDYTEEMHEDELVASANICDEIITLDDLTEEKRYTINEVFSLEMDPESIIESFRSSMAGAATYVSGRWRFYAGAYIVPTFEITKDMLVEEIKYRSKTSKRGHYNTVKGTYVAESNGFQPTDFQAVVNDIYVTEDGEELIDDLDLSGTNSPTMAKRIARIELERLRRARTISCVLHIEGIRALPGRPVLFHFPEADPAFNHLPMDVLEYNFSIENNVCKIALLLRETAPEVYDDSPDDLDGGIDDSGPSASMGDPPGTPGGPGTPPGGGGVYSDRFEVIPSGASISVECRSVIEQVCCSAEDLVLPAHALGAPIDPIAGICNVTYGGFHWEATLTMVGPGDTPGTTKFTFSGFCTRISDGANIDLFFGNVGFGSPAGFPVPGDTFDIAWGAHTAYITVFIGVGNPYSCYKTICVQEYPTDITGVAFGSCAGTTAYLNECTGTDVVAEQKRSQAHFFGTGYLGGWSDYRLTITWSYQDMVTMVVTTEDVDFYIDADSGGEFEVLIDYPLVVGKITSMAVWEFGV